MTRAERIKQFNRELYCQASFFKMKTLGSKRIDEAVNDSVILERLPDFPHPEVDEKFIPEKHSG